MRYLPYVPPRERKEQTTFVRVIEDDLANMNRKQRKLALFNARKRRENGGRSSLRLIHQVTGVAEIL